MKRSSWNCCGKTRKDTGARDFKEEFPDVHQAKRPRDRDFSGFEENAEFSLVPNFVLPRPGYEALSGFCVLGVMRVDYCFPLYRGVAKKHEPSMKCANRAKKKTGFPEHIFSRIFTKRR